MAVLSTQHSRGGRERLQHGTRRRTRMRLNKPLSQAIGDHVRLVHRRQQRVCDRLPTTPRRQDRPAGLIPRLLEEIRPLQSTLIGVLGVLEVCHGWKTPYCKLANADLARGVRLGAVTEHPRIERAPAPPASPRTAGNASSRTRRAGHASRSARRRAAPPAGATARRYRRPGRAAHPSTHRATPRPPSARAARPVQRAENDRPRNLLAEGVRSRLPTGWTGVVRTSFGKT